MLLHGSQWPLLLLGIVAVAIFLSWTARGGGYATTVWYPSALVFLGVSCFVVLWCLNRCPRPTASVVAAGLLLVFTFWSFASIAWSADRGIAWEGANRTLLYLTIYSPFALLPWTAHGRFAARIVRGRRCCYRRRCLSAGSRFWTSRHLLPVGAAGPTGTRTPTAQLS